MNIKTVTLVTSLMISMGVPAMNKQSSVESQTVKKANEQQVMNGSDKNFTGSVAIKPLTSVT